MQPNIVPLGETALLVEPLTNERAIALGNALRAQAEVISVTPAATSLVARFNPLRVNADELARDILALLGAPLVAQMETRTVSIPTCFDGEDLPEVARALNTTEQDVVARLCAQPWRVMMIGFAAGFPYLGPLPPALTLPRRATPRPAVPPGSVAIAAGMAGIYPFKLPGGWHVVGRANAILFDATRQPPCLLQPGDFAQFTRCNV